MTGDELLARLDLARSRDKILLCDRLKVINVVEVDAFQFTAYLLDVAGHTDVDQEQRALV